MLEVVVQSQVSSNCQDRVRDRDIARPEARVALHNIGVDASHGSGVSEDEDIAFATLHSKDGVVGTYPHTRSVVQEEIRPAKCDE